MLHDLLSIAINTAKIARNLCIYAYYTIATRIAHLKG